MATRWQQRQCRQMNDGQMVLVQDIRGRKVLKSLEGFLGRLLQRRNLLKKSLVLAIFYTFAWKFWGKLGKIPLGIRSFLNFGLRILAASFAIFKSKEMPFILSWAFTLNVPFAFTVIRAPRAMSKLFIRANSKLNKKICFGSQKNTTSQSLSHETPIYRVLTWRARRLENVQKYFWFFSPFEIESHQWRPFQKWRKGNRSKSLRQSSNQIFVKASFPFESNHAKEIVFAEV